MKYTFSTFEIFWPARGSRWTGYQTRALAEKSAGDDGLVIERTFTADVPAWRVASLEAEIAAGRRVATYTGAGVR